MYDEYGKGSLAVKRLLGFTVVDKQYTAFKRSFCLV